MNKTGPKRMMREPSKMAPKQPHEQLHSKFKRGLNKEWFHCVLCEYKWNKNRILPMSINTKALDRLLGWI